MKQYKLIALVLILGLCSFVGVAYATDYPANPGEIKRPIGGRSSTAVRTYMLCRNGSQSANLGIISIGSAVVWDTISDDGVTVRMTTTSGDNAFAGIAVTTIQTSDNNTATAASHDDGRRNWGYIQVYGYNGDALTGGANGNAAGDLFITSSDSGRITTLEGCSFSGDSGALAGYNSKIARQLQAIGAKGGFFFDANSDNSSTTEVFIIAD